MKAVELENVVKVYAGGNKAVADVSFALDEGAVFGFLGPNGAGKTTTIKMLNGMLAPTGGSCSVFGLNPAEEPEKVHALAGVITEHAQMYDNFTGMQNLQFFGKVFGLDKQQATARGTQLLAQLELLAAKDRKLSSYSTGMRQRLSLARALMHKPRILFLDEPTAGLDPESAQNVNNLIKQLARDGTTVFLCTHQLRYAEEICTAYGLIDEGALLAVGGIDELRSKVYSGLKVEVKTNLLPAGANAVKRGDGIFELSVANEKDTAALVRQIVEQGGDVYSVSARKLSLEELYFAFIEQKKKGGAAHV